MGILKNQKKKRTLEHRIANLDANKDGKINPEEWLSPNKAIFSEVDKNNDGVIQKKELRSWGTPKKRNMPAYQLLIGLTLIPPLIIFNPLTVPVVGYFTTAFKMWRLIWIMPISIFLATFIVEFSMLEVSRVSGNKKITIAISSK